MEFNLNDFVTTRSAPGIKWIDIVGYEKAGKTKTLVELSKHIPSLYVDFDLQGTKPYEGQFIQVAPTASVEGAARIISLVDFINKIMPNMEHMGKKILILDPINEFVDMVKDQLLAQFGVSDLADYKVTGMGNGWTILYNKIQTYFQTYFKAFDLVITVTHLKLDKYFAGDIAAIQGAKLDLVGKTQQFVQRNADVHLVFTSKKNEHGKWVTLINEDTANSMISVPLGCRDYKFLERLETGEDLIREVGKMFGKEIVISYSPNKEITL